MKLKYQIGVNDPRALGIADSVAAALAERGVSAERVYSGVINAVAETRGGVVEAVNMGVRRWHAGHTLGYSVHQSVMDGRTAWKIRTRIEDQLSAWVTLRSMTPVACDDWQER